MTFSTQLASQFTPISSVYDTASITQALSWAQSFVESYCNRSENGFDQTTLTNALVDPNPTRRSALLPHIPVSAVSSVNAYLPNQTSTGFTWTALTNFAFDGETGLLYDTTGQPGVNWNFGPSWPWLPQSLQVTFTYGYATVPSGLINAACRFAQQYLENPALLLQREVGSFNERYAGNTGGVGIVINEFDERIMDRYVLTSIG